MTNLKGRMVICPKCECEEWEIYSDCFQCFLCKLRFHPKDLLLGMNIYSTNKNLEFLYKINRDNFEIDNGQQTHSP